MASLEEDVICELVEKISKKNIKNKKIKAVEKTDQCKAGKRITTYGIAYKKIQDGEEVILVKEKDKISAFVRCLKTSNEGCDYCNIHFKMNSSNLKIFDKDIKPEGLSDKNRWVATLKDEFFDNMRKKKENLSDPVSIILQNKKSKAYYMLAEYAKTLILDNLNNEKVVNTKTSKYSKKVSSEQKVKTAVEDSNDYLNEDEIIETKHISEDKSEDESEDKSEDESEDEEELVEDEEAELQEENEDDFIKIESNDGQVFYIKDNEAFGENDDETYSNVGIFTEVKKKYHTIIHEEKYYTIFFNHTHPRKGNIKLCIVSNKIYDAKMNHIGDGIKMDSNTNYDLKFFDEI